MSNISASDLREAVAFDEPVGDPAAPPGVTRPIWTERHACRAQFIYARGSDVVEAARLQGRPIFKVRIRQCRAARSITTDWQMRDMRRVAKYSIREVDAITDRRWVYLVVEGGKAAG